MILVDFISIDRFESQRNKLKLMVQTIEKELSHPGAKAFLHSAVLDSEQKFKVNNLKTVAGGGVNATLLDDEDHVHECVVSELSIMPEVIQSVFNKKLFEITLDAKKYVFVTVNEEAAAIAILDEQLRSSTEEVIENLQSLGLEIQILTGDSTPKWENIAGVKIESRLTSE